MAYSKAQQEFQEFRIECHDLAVGFVKELKSYLQIPETQFSLFSIDANIEFKLVQPALVSALKLRKDSLWHFDVGLTVCSAPETLPQELILLHILLRKDVDGGFFLRYGEKGDEHKIEKEENWSFTPFLDYLHKFILEVYRDQVIHSLSQDSRRRIGI